MHGRVFLTRVSLKAPVNTPDKYVNTLNRTYTLQLCVVPCFFFFIIIITDEGPLSTNMYCELCQTRKLRREFPSAAITHKCEHAPSALSKGECFDSLNSFFLVYAKPMDGVFRSLWLATTIHVHFGEYN